MNGVLEMSFEQWKEVLRLARMWNFSKVETHATAHLKERFKDDPVSLIAIYHECEFELDDKFVAAVQVLVNRKTDLTVPEAEKIGISSTMKLCTVRGAYRVGATANLQARIRNAWGMPPPERDTTNRYY